MRIRSALFTTMTGKLGGSVGSTSRGGLQTLRKLVRPHNPRSEEQTLLRSGITAITARWRATLTDAQRAAWAALAGPAESGIDVYLAANTPIWQRSRGSIADLVNNAPSSRHCPQDTSFFQTPDFVYGEPNITLFLREAALRKCGYTIHLSRPQHLSRLSQQNDFYYAAQVDTDNEGELVLFTPDGSLPVAGQVIYLRAVPVGSSNALNSGRNGQTGAAVIYRLPA